MRVRCAHTKRSQSVARLKRNRWLVSFLRLLLSGAPANFVSVIRGLISSRLQLLAAHASVQSFTPAMRPPPSEDGAQQRLPCRIKGDAAFHSVHLIYLVLAVSVSLLTLKDSLAVLVETESGDLHVGGVDGDVGLLSVRLLFNEFLNVNAPSAPVNFSDFALAVLVGATHDLDRVSVPHWDRASQVLLGQFFAELGRHHLSTDGGGGSEVRLAGLSTLAGHVCGRNKRDFSKQ